MNLGYYIEISDGNNKMYYTARERWNGYFAYSVFNSKCYKSFKNAYKKLEVAEKRIYYRSNNRTRLNKDNIKINIVKIIMVKEKYVITSTEDEFIKLTLDII